VPPGVCAARFVKAGQHLAQSTERLLIEACAFGSRRLPQSAMKDRAFFVGFADLTLWAPITPG